MSTQKPVDPDGRAGTRGGAGMAQLGVVRVDAVGVMGMWSMDLGNGRYREGLGIVGGGCSLICRV